MLLSFTLCLTFFTCVRLAAIHYSYITFGVTLLHCQFGITPTVHVWVASIETATDNTTYLTKYLQFPTALATDKHVC